MTENTNPAANGEASQANNAPQASVQKIYVKDASFEVPHAPAIFQEQGESQIQLQLNQKVNNFAQNLFEVTLTVTVTCTLGEKTVYLAEVQQAGVFTIANFPQEQIGAVLGTFCPNTLFPYARSAISDMVLQGGFPPFLLQPISFEQLYAEQVRRRSQEQAGQVATA